MVQKAMVTTLVYAFLLQDLLYMKMPAMGY